MTTSLCDKCFIELNYSDIFFVGKKYSSDSAATLCAGCFRPYYAQLSYDYIMPEDLPRLMSEAPQPRAKSPFVTGAQLETIQDQLDIINDNIIKLRLTNSSQPVKY